VDDVGGVNNWVGGGRSEIRKRMFTYVLRPQGSMPKVFFSVKLAALGID
jgi:hypothetical protein